MIHRAKKSLGQNFLKSKMILRKVADAGEIKKEDVILEIGPGKGTLTEVLLERAGKVIAVEKDNGLFEFLREKFTREINSGSLVLVHGDILAVDVSTAVLNFSNGDDAEQDILRKIPKPRNYKIIANIPYNITGAILKKFLSAEHQPELMVLMVQYEVAQRIIGRDRPSSAKATAGRKESLLSISVKAYGDPKMIMKVDKRYFSPPPKVNSGIIKIAGISRKFFREHGIDEEKFWEIVKKGFAHKRKKLSSNLKPFQKHGGVASVERKKILQNLGNKRAEDIPLPEWGEIVQNLCKT